MLMQINGSCEGCQTKFGHLDTVQSASVTCSKCGKEEDLCRMCKYRGCSCVGKFEDAWDKNPRIMF
jgi:hypothetical protein